MRKIILLALVFVASASFNTVTAQKNKGKKTAASTVQPVKIVTPADSLSYAMGMDVTRELMGFLKGNFNVDSVNMPDVIRGFEDGIKGDPKDNAYSAGIQIANIVMKRMLPEMSKEFEGTDMALDKDVFTRGFADALKKVTTHFTPEAAGTYARNASNALREKKGRQVREQGEHFLAENAQKEGVVTLLDGTEFDSSYKRDPQTSTFRPNQVIKGWTEALTMMPEGSKWELYIPQNLAYGERQAGKIPPYSTLIFTVELEKVNAK